MWSRDIFIIITRLQVQFIVLCNKDIYVQRNENEDNKRVSSSCLQYTTCESFAVILPQQIEMSTIEKATEVARQSV